MSFPLSSIRWIPAGPVLSDLTARVLVLLFPALSTAVIVIVFSVLSASVDSNPLKPVNSQASLLNSAPSGRFPLTPSIVAVTDASPLLSLALPLTYSVFSVGFR